MSIMMRKSDEDEQLLFEYMTEQQIKDYREKGRFWVIGTDGRVYQLSDGKGLWVFDNGHPVASRHVWAYEYDGGVTASKETSLLTQLLFLTTDSAQELVSTGCGEETFHPITEGCPPMSGAKVVTE